MTPTKYTQTLTTRVSNEVVKVVEKRAKNRNITINAWLNWAILQGIRSHKKR